jgi:hypothetical protein
MVGSGDTADVEGAVLHSPEPVKEYGLAIEMSRTSVQGTLPSPNGRSTDLVSQITPDASQYSKTIQMF